LGPIEMHFAPPSSVRFINVHVRCNT